LFLQAVAFAVAFALLNVGSNIAARIAMMTMTTSNSIKVKARRLLRFPKGLKIGFGFCFNWFSPEFLPLQTDVDYSQESAPVTRTFPDNYSQFAPQKIPCEKNHK
jgi:hypothetical protein